MDDPVAVLRAATTLISKSAWTTEADARDADGGAVMPTDPSATSYSLTGALLKVGKAASGAVFLDALFALGKAVGAVGVDEVREWSWDIAPVRTRELCQRVWAWEEKPERTINHALHALQQARESCA